MSPFILFHIISGIFTVFFGYYTLRSNPSKVKTDIVAIGLTIIAVTGLFIRSFGSVSFLHIFSAITLVSVLMYLVSKKEYSVRVKNIVGPYIGLIIAFAFTLLPGRRLGNMVSDFSGTVIYTYTVFLLLLLISIIITYDLVKKYFMTKK